MSDGQRPIAYIALRAPFSAGNAALRLTIERWMVRRGNRVAVRLGAGDPGRTGDAIIAVGPMPIAIMAVDAPLPSSVFRADQGQDLAWPGWRRAAMQHRAHLIVAPLTGVAAGDRRAPSPREAMRQAATCTAETVSALATLDAALGVFWGPAELFSDAADFAEPSPSRRKTKAELLIRLRFFAGHGAEAENVGATTKGLALFADREVLHPPTREPATVVASFLLNLCNYLIDHGPVIGDGQTVGRDRIDRRRIAFARTAAGEDVIRLEPEPSPVA